MLAFFDTETTGFIKPQLDHADQPHLVQVAILLTDLEGNELESFEAIVNNPGVEIPERVAEIHGISTEKAEAEGIPLDTAIASFALIASKATIMVAHNVDFDRVVMGAAYWRAQQLGFEGLPYPSLLPHCCTMKSATDIVRIPKARGSGFKWPKLIESHLHFFGEGFEDAHSAMADVRACKRVYFALKAAGAFDEV